MPADSNGAGQKSHQKHGQRATKNSGVLPDFKFLDCPLTDEQKSELRTAYDTGAILPTDAIGLVEEGLKLSLTYDHKHSAFIACFTDKREASPTTNHCLSARGATPDAALCSLYFKHVSVLRGDWSRMPTPDTRDLHNFG